MAATRRIAYKNTSVQVELVSFALFVLIHLHFTHRRGTLCSQMAPLNYFLIPGVTRYSRSAMNAKKRLEKKTKVGGAAPVARAVAKKDKTPAPTTKVVPMKGGKNGATRTVSLVKAPRFYPTETACLPKKSCKTKITPRAPATRSSITPGTVLILLAGRFRGKHVVYLKTLESGLLLVTGPYKINGIPIRRVNQAYVIATSTKIDMSKVSIDDKFTDAYFKYEKEPKKKATAAELFGEDAVKRVINAERVTDQTTVDTQLLSAIKKTPMLQSYLKSSFTLTKGQYPHAMKF
ncbi:hypothetical protein BDV3_007320 [Batrachochytrium dendrobatidis]